ncbi:hypothetical protein DNTS_014098 [Danionella cerebrum]|uniref:Uncharacterized protein n=1 Tax=Danionella cerebrum TaxID=2873325 RepID=A0A553RNZ7_9TELE|nr:hypothetical protein DNTS_014098 [Danionella translucida]
MEARVTVPGGFPGG